MYGVVSTGFSPGDVTQTTDTTFHPVVRTLEAETLTAYELGSKNRFLDNRLQVNGDVYYYDYGAYQTAALNTSPQTPQTPTFDTIALPMKSYGVELEVEARPTPNGRASFYASYTNARYGSFGPYAYLYSKHEVPGVAPFQASRSATRRCWSMAPSATSRPMTLRRLRRTGRRRVPGPMCTLRPRPSAT